MTTQAHDTNNEIEYRENVKGKISLFTAEILGKGRNMVGGFYSDPNLTILWNIVLTRDCDHNMMMKSESTTIRTGRRSKNRVSTECANTSNSAVQPGMMSGRYSPLDQLDLERIHKASLDILENIGLANPSKCWLERVASQGGWVSSNGRLCFPAAMIENAIAKAGRNFVIHGRDPRHDMEISDARTYLGAGTPQVETLDIETGKYRETKLVDLYDTVRLADTLEHIHWIKRPGIARDIAESDVLDINTSYAIMSATTKPAATGYWTPYNLEQALAMYDISLGGDGSGRCFRQRPFMQVICAHVVPPLTFAPDNCDVVDAAVKNGMVPWLLSAGQSGSTAPTPLAGAIAQGNAEVLAALTVINLDSPGYPVVYGNWPMVCDLRTGAVACSGGESGLLAAAVGQLARFYDLPSIVIAGAASAKVPDAQEGWEKGATVTAAALGGANLIYTGAGNLADLLGGSLDTFLIDGEMSGAALRTVRGIEVNDESLSVAVIDDVTKGPGHYLGHQQTLRLMKSEHLYPSPLADRNSIHEWQDTGALDIRARALQRTREILRTHYPQHVDSRDDMRIRQRFDIRLAQSDMGGDANRW